MAKVLVLYYSAWGHLAQLTHAEAEGARTQGEHVARIAARLAAELPESAAESKAAVA
ncbi:MAG: hypothetical protein ACRESO_09045 [Gammaproteobacteria bacterium]